jgi:hypothetical protein
MPSSVRKDKPIKQVAAWLRLLIAPGQITELRALKVRRGRERPHTESGFFDYEHLDQMAEAALTISPVARGVYFTMNPLKPALLARRANRVEYAEEGESAKDDDVLRRRWLLIDADPVRDPHVSATDEEKMNALEVVRLIRVDLAAQGWAAPIMGDSGNGYHLLYPTDSPANDGGAVEHILNSLAAKYNTPQVTIDQKVFNPARICKVPGTIARKGDSVPDRPHRRAKLLEAL